MGGTNNVGSLLRRTFPPQPELFPARSSGRVGQEERPQESPGGKANEYRLAVMNERHKGGIEGQLKKKKKHSHGAQSEHYVYIFRLLPAVILTAILSKL